MMEITQVIFDLPITTLEKTMNANSHCVRIVPGGADCLNQIKKGRCSALPLGGQCDGNNRVLGANAKGADSAIATQRAVQKLETYRSTGKGLGHLSTTRALHSSPVPFDANK